jgi:hypothetical protein
MSNEEKKDELLSLIRIVDKEFNHANLGFLFSLEIGGPFVLILVIYTLFVFYISSNGINDIFSSGALLPLVIAFFALIISIWSFFDKRTERVIADQKYYFINHKYHEKTRFKKFILYLEWMIGYEAGNQVFESNPSLKGLLLIKARNPEISLEHEYLRTDSQLTEKRIIENLLYY